MHFLSRAPWWAISALFHLVLLLGASLVGFAVRPTGESITICVFGVAKPVPAAPLKPVKPFKREMQGPEEPEERTIEGAVPDVADEVRDPDPNSIDGGTGNGIDLLTLFRPGPRGNRTDVTTSASTDLLGIGAGGGGSGNSPGPGGWRNRMRIKASPLTKNAVRAGLLWLARHQEEDGRWSTKGFAGRCRGEARCGGQGSGSHDSGLTGLALLAFLGAGFLPTTRSGIEDPFEKGRAIHYGDTVRKGLRWLKEGQDLEGCFPNQEGEFMYDHAIATLAMAEAAWLCISPLYREPAQRGVDFLQKAQNPGSGWRYTVRPGDSDTSVTGWCVMALKSAELSGLALDPAAFEGARRWLARVTSTEGVVGYESPGDAGSTMPGINDRWQAHPAMTAVGLLMKAFLERRRGDPWMKAAAGRLLRDLPLWDEKKKSVDFYYWYYAALALFQYDAPDGPVWKAFNESMKQALLPFQSRSQAGCREGSWDPAADRWGRVGGRVYATALNVLTLEVYYRYPSVFIGSRPRSN
jgi:hypothetical protein